MTWRAAAGMRRSYITKETAIRLPVNVFNRSYKAYAESGERGLQRKVAEQGVLLQANVPLHQITSAIKLALTHNYVNIWEPIKREWSDWSEGVWKGHYPKDEEAESVEDIVQAREETEKVPRVLQMLRPQEKDVIRKRFGFNGEVQTLEKIAQSY